MNKAFLLSLGLFLTTAATTQAQTPATATTVAEATPYRATATKRNDLVHTKLDVRFDYKKRYLYGKEWVTLKPHAYPTDSLQLDAKGMDIQTVALVNGNANQPLKFTYDEEFLRINLGKTVQPGTEYTVYIEYTAKPDELKVKGSAAITDAKGLYFINPDSSVAGKPVQIWTQGETEASSAWFPTIDRPNQKTTSEISMTVPSKYVTLSNGKMTDSKPAGAGLRTDTWKMELPHSPYLFMMAVGDFKITHDTWRGKPVDYYLEPKYAPYAKAIFGNTPEMLEFFSNRLGVEYPWNKYAQVVARDYVSGAMENTTATLHGEAVAGTAREMLDRPYGSSESIVAHELFHQWFGDYVTAESWSNLTVNESFADFSEGLWAEHKYGKDAADAHRFGYIRRYLSGPGNAQKDLVRFHYADKEDMFDGVTYQKGGAILDMLRTYLGDDVFFKSLTKYLTDNKFGNGEAHQLRLAFEAMSGKDLNWFFNQWYFGAGHPVVTIDYGWDAATKQQSVTIKQTQEGQKFILPLAIDVYVKGKAERHQVLMTEGTQTFRFAAAGQPELVNVDATKMTLWQKTDNKPFSAYVYQYQHAPLYLDRREALVAAQSRQKEDAAARTLLFSALNDKFYGLRLAAAQSLDLKNADLRKKAPALLRKQLSQEKETAVQAALLSSLATLNDKRDQNLYEKYLDNQSYNVQGAALNGLSLTKPAVALSRAKSLEADSRGALTQAITEVYAKYGDASQWPYIQAQFDEAGAQQRINMLEALDEVMVRTTDPAIFNAALTRVKELGIKYKQYGIDQAVLGLLGDVQQRKTGATATQAKQDLEKAAQEIQQAQ
ncbi:M1 family peptidase [Hymenobacter aerilatus]|uniref:Aminopeptidase N n=1 Tax=Hymenobacter aerilatus TaxID=2932251 RepID=A0A8T9T709_9BACT|nr:M1 family aminopeptidase [Hymenobacter aerilatus]UOR07609.1 M1 family peptidase [Hymenobacter aerilatus]